MTHTIAIILARRNSKGVPLKNLRTVGGVSLVGRAVAAARQSGCFDRVIVSTDGADIAAEARNHGAETLMRPDELATDTAASLPALLHALDAAGIDEGVAVLLQPTSPLRNARHIAEAMRLFDGQNRQGSVVSACAAEHHPYKTLIADGYGGYAPVHQAADLSAPRQTLPAAYRPNGAIYIADIADLRRTQSFFAEPLQLFVMDEASSVDIDCEADLQLAERYWREMRGE